MIRRSPKTGSAVDQQHEELARRENELRDQMQKLQQMIEEAPRLAQETSRRQREELLERAHQRGSRLDASLSLRDKRWGDEESGRRRPGSLHKERREGRIIFLVLVIALAVAMTRLLTRFHFEHDKRTRRCLRRAISQAAIDRAGDGAFSKATRRRPEARGKIKGRERRGSGSGGACCSNFQCLSRRYRLRLVHCRRGAEQRTAEGQQSFHRHQSCGMTKRELPALSIVELTDLLRRKEVSPVEVLQALGERIDAVDPEIGAYLAHDFATAMAEAEKTDVSLPLGGVPIAIKDLINVEGQQCTCASKILRGYRAPYSATVIGKLRGHGAIPFGRMNMDEFAMGSSTENSSAQVTRNPWDLSRVPGGSSGGSAAAIAADIAFGALGSDTGGSIRQPAALSGIVGFKPSYGRVSRFGLVAFASSFDQIGPLTKT